MIDGGQLIRLNANGSLDGSFGSGGVASPKLGLAPWYDGLAVLPSGKIVATGHTVVAGLYQFTVGGYNANGSLDDGSKADSTPGDQFGSKGKVLISFSGYSGGRGFSVKVDPMDGGLVLMGSAGTQNSTTALARLSASGQYDTGFAGTGKLVLTHPDGLPQGSALGLQSDGSIVVIGGLYYPNTSSRDAMVVRFTAEGALDPFATGPVGLYDISGGLEEGCVDGAVTSYDRILCAGYIRDQYPSSTPILMRILP